MSLRSKIDAHLNNIAFYQTIFSLPFAYMAAFLGAKGNPDIWDIVWITVTIVTARSAALALDNLIDLKYDKKQSRMEKRPMVAGEITVGEVKALIAVCLILFVVAVLQLDPICIKLLPVAALPFIIYPYMKRVTCFCHYVCGIAIAMAPAGGWVAVTGGDFSPPMLLLCLAVTLWIGGFDVVYGAQDENFDKEQGLHSMATALGAKNALVLAKVTHVICIICFFILGQMLELAWPYFIGVGIASGTLWYQHSLITPTDFSAFTRQYYMRNGIVSVAIAVCTIVSIYM